MRPFHKLFLWILLALWISACGGGISKQVRSQVTFMGPFNQLQQNPGQYMGEMVMLGGRIIETRSLDKGMELIVLQLALNRSDRPESEDRSQGRYLVHSSQFLDPAVYSAGTYITVAGRLVRTEERPIGQMIYSYPLIELEEIHKWPPPEEKYPRFHFGIGVGTTF